MRYNVEDKKSAVRQLQRLLLEISYSSDSPRISIDGIYGKNTREAVRRFQSRCGLPVTGDTDFETWCALLSEYKAARKQKERR